MDPEIADAVRVLATTGMRRGELLALRWRDIDLINNEIAVAAALVDAGPGVGIVRKATKTSDWRDVPLTATAAAALQRQRRRSDDNGGCDADTYVLRAAGSAVLPLRPDTFSDRWLAARGRSGITMQHIRHFAAMRLLLAGNDITITALWLGHEQIATTNIYLHADMTHNNKPSTGPNHSTPNPADTGPPTSSSHSCRVAPAHCCAGAPSEPSERLSPHSAQAGLKGLGLAGEPRGSLSLPVLRRRWQ